MTSVEFFAGTESGLITDIIEKSDGYLLWFEVEDGIELGINVYRNDIRRTPNKGSEVVVKMNEKGTVLYFKLDGEVQWNRTEEQATLWKEIRRRETELVQLKAKANESENS